MLNLTFQKYKEDENQKLGMIKEKSMKFLDYYQKEFILKMIDKYDVLVENFKAKKLGIGLDITKTIESEFSLNKKKEENDNNSQALKLQFRRSINRDENPVLNLIEKEKHVMSLLQVVMSENQSHQHDDIN